MASDRTLRPQTKTLAFMPLQQPLKQQLQSRKYQPVSTRANHDNDWLRKSKRREDIESEKGSSRGISERGDDFIVRKKVTPGFWSRNRFSFHEMNMTQGDQHIFFFLLQTVVNWANFLASFKKRKPLLNRKIFSLDSFGLHSFGPQVYRIQSEEFPSHLRTLNWLQLTFIVAEYSIAFAIISCTSSHSFACTQIRFQ